MASKFLGRSAILGIKPVLQKIDDVPGWDGHIYIRELTAADVRKVTAARDKKVDPISLSALYMVCAICDGLGTAVFEEDDVETLVDQLGYRATNHIVDKILKLSDLLDDDDEDVEGNESD